jgi:hypothetical protein
MDLITDPGAKLLGVAGGKKKRGLVLQPRRRCGGWMGERKRGTEKRDAQDPNTCRRIIRLLEDSALCFRSFLTAP